MRDFHTNTRDRRAARVGNRLWSLPVGLLVAALIVGLGVRVGSALVPLDTVGYGTQGAPQAAGDSGATGPGRWVQEILGGGPTIPEGGLNVLVLGVDDRSDGEGMGNRSDTLMLVRLVPERDEIKLLSVPRDLLVEVAPGRQDRINAAYSYGGIEQTVRVFEDFTEIPVDRYVIVDYEGFERVVDAMGGVQVEVEPGVFPEKWNFQEGIDRLNGHRALFYARYRGTPGGDLDRIERQQRLVAALRSKALRWNTVKKLPEIVSVIDQNVQTDLGFDEALSLARLLVSKGQDDRVTSVQLKGMPKTLPDGDQVLVPDEEANEVILREFRF
jgi:LCP family protein required for cell wall assembly